MVTGDDDDDDDRRRTTRMATAQRASKLRMMATMTTVATGDGDNGATEDGAMGYEEDDDGDGRQRRWRLATTVMAMVDDDNKIISDGTTGNKVGNDGDGLTGNNNDNNDTSCEATTNRRRLLLVVTARSIVFNDPIHSAVVLCQQLSVKGWELLFESILLRVHTARCIHLSPPTTSEIYCSQFQFHSEAGVKHIG